MENVVDIYLNELKRMRFFIKIGNDGFGQFVKKKNQIKRNGEKIGYNLKCINYESSSYKCPFSINLTKNGKRV